MLSGNGNVQAVELVFLLLLLFVVAFGMLARKLQTPYPIVLVIAGTLLGFVPHIPKVTLNPDVVFFVILPPLLYAAAWVTSWRDFSYNLVSILMLAFGLVAFTVWGVSTGAHWLFPGFDWRLGFVLGAIVAPTDAIAATAIANRLGLPKRIVDILEGESLVNDVSGLLALEFGIAMVVRGQTPAVIEGFGRMSFLILAGLGVGLSTAWLVERVERYIDDGPIEIAISILTPYAAYFAADRIHASGVLAVVACGLYLSRRSSLFFSAEVRLQIWGFWDSFVFILNGLVFVLIGLQLPHVLSGIQEYRLSTLLLFGGLFSGLVILLRMIWMPLGAFLANRIRTRIFHQNEKLPSLQAILVSGWTGMRGVISLAAAIALPETLANGNPFPHRDLILFLAFSVIFVTLVLQGLTLPFVVRTLGLASAPGERTQSSEEEDFARREMLQAALAHLQSTRTESESEFQEIYDDLSGHYQHRLAAVSAADNPGNALTPGHRERHTRLLRDLLRIERQTAIRLRDRGRINDETLRQLEYELDLREANPTAGI
jgi:CPA1 family monovalent cation:H+ antiporter